MKPLKVHQDLQDTTVMLGQPIKLLCEISPGNVPGRWYRNGQLVQPNDRINIIHRNKYVTSVKLCSIKTNSTQMLMSFWFSRVHRLEIASSSLHDAGDYTFVPEGYSQSLSAKLHIIGTQPIIYWTGQCCILTSYRKKTP